MALALKPPAAVAEAARRGLALRDRFGRGGTDVGVHRAEGLAARREVTRADVKSIYSYLARHAVDKDAAGFGDEENPSAGYIAWLLWGGDAARDWIGKLHDIIDAVPE